MMRKDSHLQHAAMLVGASFHPAHRLTPWLTSAVRTTPVSRPTPSWRPVVLRLALNPQVRRRLGGAIGSHLGAVCAQTRLALALSLGAPLLERLEVGSDALRTI